MPALREDRSIGELFGQLSQDMTLLVQAGASAGPRRNEREDLQSDQQPGLGGGWRVRGLCRRPGTRGGADPGDFVKRRIFRPAVSALIVGAILAVAGYVMLQPRFERVEAGGPRPPPNGRNP